MADYCFDLEIYPNIFSMAIVACDKSEAHIFEVSDRKNQMSQMLTFLRKLYKRKDRMVGFNNVGFDYPLLHMILSNKGNVSVWDIYQKAVSIIHAQDDDSKFANTVPEHKVLIPQIDLYKIHHFDNKARATSLKMLEFNMLSDDIEDLPFPPGTRLSSRQIDQLLKYNAHDVMQTLAFYHKSKHLIEFREELSRKYGKNFLNHNDTKIGKDYLIMKMEEEIPGCCYKKVGNGRKMQQTIRDSIDINDVIFPYIKFDRPEFNAIKDWFSKQVITETKGVFSDILESDLGDVAKYAEMKVKRKKLKDHPTDEEMMEFRKEYPLCWITETELKSKKTSVHLNWNIAETLNVVVEGIRYDFGTGGLHGCCKAGIYESDNEYVYEDRDVKSYYPNMAIKNRIYPEHLSEKFCDIYEEIYDQRQLYPKGSAENAMFKLALNGSYGASNDQYSPLYDPKFTMAITIGGQLSLCMLAEKLIEKGAEVMMLNTDGLTFKVKRDNLSNTNAVCDEWCDITKLELESVFYSKMCVRDINNYIMVYE